MMYLSEEVIRWAIVELRSSCHPFIGITFLASKQFGMPVGEPAIMSLDHVTLEHLRVHHLLDPKSAHFFQPFKSPKKWVASNYASTGLQATNTQTFGGAFIHTNRSRNWAFAEGYIENIRQQIDGNPSYSRPSLAAVAVWLGKTNTWPSNTDIAKVVENFRETYNLNDEEVKQLFDESKVPPGLMQILDSEESNLTIIAYSFATPPGVSPAADATISNFRLSGVATAKTLELDLGKRLTVIAGDNGLGKSFLLDVAWWILTADWVGRPGFPMEVDKNFPSKIAYTIQGPEGRKMELESWYDRSTLSWKEPADRPRMPALTVYTRADGSFAVADETREKVQAGARSGQSMFSRTEVWDGKQGEIEGLVRDWVSWQQLGESGPFPILSSVLDHLAPQDLGSFVPDEPMRIPGDVRRIPTIRYSYGTVPIVFASAGVQRILLLAYLIIWSWQEHKLACQQIGEAQQRRMVILIDEIEAHLHPKWQRLVLPAIMSLGKFLSEDLQIQVITATHSPMVLASIEGEFSEESDVLAHLSLVDGLVQLERFDFYKYGDASSWLTSPIFGLSHARSREAERLIEQAKEQQLSDEPSLGEVRSITSELKKTIAPDDPFWSRWIYFARRLGEDI